MIKHLLSILAFMIVSFAVQGLSHFVINVEHYAGIGFMRSGPIIPMGLSAMVIQGLIMTLALSRLSRERATMRDGLTVALAFGLFLGVYIAIVQPAKYLVPSIPDWAMIEGLAALIQFTLYGVLLGYIHQRFNNNGG